MTVKLTSGELLMTAIIGSRRQIEAVCRGLPDRHGYDGDGWGIHIEGAAGEIAAARVLNRFWGGTVNTFKNGGDVGEIQVRTRSKPEYDLIVREGDRDGDVFILVIGQSPNFEVVGWIRGSQAKKEAWKKTHGDRPAAFFVPRTALRPL